MFVIPENCPSSIREKLGGSIEYKCTVCKQYFTLYYFKYLSASFFQAYIDAGILYNGSCWREFNVTCPIALNKNPGDMCVQTNSNSQTFCCCCCTSGIVEGKFTIDRKAYFSGEPIILNGSIENNSNVVIRRVWIGKYFL